ncbi:MAG TPA: hypothetical protein VFB21_05235 [Chthonomonadaceae bacterium]|nr:hypothetical protein [Chthonomonadaceae bacterium]
MGDRETFHHALESWLGELRRYTAFCREHTPLPNPARFDSLENQQRELLREILRLRKSEREKPENRVGRETDDSFLGFWRPTVFRTTPVGLLAASEVYSLDTSDTFFLLPEEASPDKNPYRYPDWEAFSWMLQDAIQSWAYFEPLAEKSSSLSLRGKRGMKRVRKKYPIAPTSAYWLLREGTMLGRLAGGGEEHLFEWTGSELILLEDRFGSWIS